MGAEFKEPLSPCSAPQQARKFFFSFWFLPSPPDQLIQAPSQASAPSMNPVLSEPVQAPLTTGHLRLPPPHHKKQRTVNVLGLEVGVVPCTQAGSGREGRWEGAASRGSTLDSPSARLAGSARPFSSRATWATRTGAPTHPTTHPSTLPRNICPPPLTVGTRKAAHKVINLRRKGRDGDLGDPRHSVHGDCTPLKDAVPAATGVGMDGQRGEAVGGKRGGGGWRAMG